MADLLVLLVRVEQLRFLGELATSPEEVPWYPFSNKQSFTNESQ